MISELTHDAAFKVILLGDAGSGKSCIANRFHTDSFKSDMKALGVDFRVKVIKIEQKVIKIVLWDFGGEQRFRFLLSSYLKGVSGILYVFDVSNYSSLLHIDDWLLIVRKTLTNKIPIFLVGSKMDSPKREVSEKEGEKLAKERDLDGYFECSAKTGANIEKIFENLTKAMIKNSKLS